MASRQFYKYLLKLFLLTLVTLFVIRLFFSFYHLDALTNALAGIILQAFLLGSVLDSVVISTTLLLIALPLMIIDLLLKKDMRRGFFFLSSFLLALIFLVNIADPFFYDHFGTRMNHMAAQGGDRLDITLPMLWKGYPVLKILFAFLIGMFLFMKLHSRFYKKMVLAERKPIWVLYTLLTLILFSFQYYGPPFWTLTSFSSSPLANQMSSNGIYTFIKSYDLEKQFNRDIASYEYGDPATALKHFTERIIQKDELALNDYYPTLRKFKSPLSTEKKNIVVIILESFAASNVGVLGGRKLSPNFDRYSKQGLLFSDCFSSGVRTQHGITAIVGSFPPLLGSSLIRRKGISDFSTLGNCMLKNGYETTFIHNGHGDYDDMDLFLKQGGFEKMYDVDDFAEWKFRTEWGVSDEDLYKKALQEMKVGGQKPSLTVLLSMSNHEPYDVPEDFKAAHPEISKMHIREAAFYYSDHALGVFLDSCSKRPDFKNTLFLITADHGEVYADNEHGFKYFHIPALILNGSQAPGIYDATCSQIDLAVAMLWESGYSQPFHLAGQNPFSASYTPFAFSKDYESTITLCMDSVAMQWDIRTDLPQYFYIDSSKQLQPGIHMDVKTKSTMKQFAKDYLQSISYIYRYGRYKLN